MPLAPRRRLRVLLAPRRRLRVLLARLRLRGRLEAAPGVVLEPGVRFDVAAGGRVRLGAGCRLGEGTRVHAHGGQVLVGPGTVLGERCVVVALERVEVGARCRLGDGVVLVDADPVFADPERPIHEQGARTGAIRLGDGAVVDPGACLLRGVTVGEGARIAAHAVVTRPVPPGARVEGVPARALPRPADLAAPPPG